MAADKSVRDFNNAYHHHWRFIGLVESGVEILTRCERKWKTEIENGVKQAFLFALAMQDCGYPGFFSREEALKLYRPDLGDLIRMSR